MSDKVYFKLLSYALGYFDTFQNSQLTVQISNTFLHYYTREQQKEDSNFLQFNRYCNLTMTR